MSLISCGLTFNVTTPLQIIRDESTLLPVLGVLMV